jgi:two-component system, LytTR family, sensor kinase
MTPSPPPTVASFPTQATRTRWGLILGVWTVWGLLTSLQSYIGALMAGARTPMSFGTAMLLQMPQAYTWALATPVILWLGRRFPFERGKWPASAAIHLLISVTFVFLIDLGFAYHSSNVRPEANPLPLLTVAARLFVWWVLADGMLYWVVLTLGYAVEHYRRFRERELTASQLETQLVEADLQALKMQLHPHFLFNALHTIGSLVRTGERDNAVRVVAGLGDLLRRVLDGAAQQEVPLKQELEFIRNYLDIEQMRFRDRLKVAINVDPETLDATVPHLILQPLVENAIRHGIAPHLSAGRLVVVARRAEDRLLLVVRDDGPGIGNGNEETTRPGIGLTNTRARLARLYGTDFELEVGNAEDGGLEARLALPFRLAHAEWQGER